MIFSILSVAHIKWQKLLLWYDLNGVTNHPVRAWLKVSLVLCWRKLLIFYLGDRNIHGGTQKGMDLIIAWLNLQTSFLDSLNIVLKLLTWFPIRFVAK